MVPYHSKHGSRLAAVTDALSGTCSAVGVATNALRCPGTSTKSAAQVRPVRGNKNAVLTHQTRTLCCRTEAARCVNTASRDGVLPQQVTRRAGRAAGDVAPSA